MSRAALVDRGVDHEQLVADLYAAHRLSLVRTRSLRDPDAALGYLRRAVVNRSRSALRRRRTARGCPPPTFYRWSPSGITLTATTIGVGCTTRGETIVYGCP